MKKTRKHVILKKSTIIATYICLVLIVLAAIIFVSSIFINNSDVNTNEEVIDNNVSSNEGFTEVELLGYSLQYDSNVDYSNLIISCALERTEDSFQRAQEIEELRNLKINSMTNTTLLPTDYFVDTDSWEDVFARTDVIMFGSIEGEKTIYEVYYFYNDTYFVMDGMTFDGDNINYADLINECVNSPLDYSFSTAKEYEIKRNIKIDIEGLASYLKTYEFIPYDSWEEFFNNGVRDDYFKNLNQTFRTTSNLNLREKATTTSETIIELPKYSTVVFLGKLIDSDGTVWNRVYFNNEQVGYVQEQYLSDKEYTEEDVYWLAMAIHKEAGSEWVPEEIRNYIGCVVLNRVESDLFPGDTIYEVLHEYGQYPWAGYGEYCEPYEWCVNTAIDLLEGNRLLPTNIVFQAEFRQGTFTYAEYYDEVLGTTTYFCGI